MVELNLSDDGGSTEVVKETVDRPCCHPSGKLERDLNAGDYAGGERAKTCVDKMPATEPVTLLEVFAHRITVCLGNLPPTTVLDVNVKKFEGRYGLTTIRCERAADEKILFEAEYLAINVPCSIVIDPDKPGERKGEPGRLGA